MGDFGKLRLSRHKRRGKRRRQLLTAEWRQCLSKVKYTNPLDDDDYYLSYRCDYCDGWHTTRRTLR